MPHVSIINLTFNLHLCSKQKKKTFFLKIETTVRKFDGNKNKTQKFFER